MLLARYGVVFRELLARETILPRWRELLIGVRLLPAQPVIEMDYRQNNPQITAHFQQQPQKRNRIDPPGNSDAHAVPGFQQLKPPNVGQHALRERVHRDMVQPQNTRTAAR